MKWKVNLELVQIVAVRFEQKKVALNAPINFVVIVNVHKMVTTKTGDLGQTTCGNKRVDKDDLLVEVVGSIDELQAILELVGFDENKIDDLGKIMGCLGGGIECRIEELEKEIEENNLDINKFVKFKSKKALELNWARTVCRRVERRIVALNKKQMVDKNILKYFNRLSDYLFVKAIESDK
jgi:cob(I)alamin adenosyltransferase